MKHILDMSPEEWIAEVQALGQKPFRAHQILEWVWKKGVYDVQEMTNLSHELRCRLAERFVVLSGRVVSQAHSRDGVVKLLLEWPDGERVETVLIPSERRQTACVSTQVGCAMGCVFCASGIGGLRRNCTAGEIVEQVLQLQQAASRRITNVVFMGMGEPLANYDATVRALRALIDPLRGGLSARKLTVSSTGLPQAIRRLAGEDLPVTLSLSLHAPTDELRARLMPCAVRTPIRDILDAAEAFYRAKKREVTIEYTLLGDVNDSLACAEDLASLAGRLRCNVNLIRYNPVSSLPYRPATEKRIEAFAQRLRQRRVNVHLRQRRGADIDAACGQLRQRKDGSSG